MIKLYKGDNKDVLKKPEIGKFNIVYLDPPYNTKNGNLSYFDKRTHEDWKDFFKKRLKLIKEVLEPDSVIFTSIGHEELAYAKIALEEVFKNSFVAIMPRLTNNVAKTTKTISRINDFLIISKVGNVVFNGNEINFSSYKLKDKHFQKRGFYQLRRLDYRNFSYSESLDFLICFQDKNYYPNNFKSFETRKKHVFKKDWCWLWSKAKVEFAIVNDYLEVKNDKIYKKTYTKCEIRKEQKKYFLSFAERKQPFSTMELFQKKYASTFPKSKFEKFFTYPKNGKLLEFLFTLPKFKNKKVLDPFAGTGISGIISSELKIFCTLIQKSEKINKKSRLWNQEIKNIFELTKRNLLKRKIKLEIFEK